MASPNDNPAEPVGQGDYTVEQGDCLSSIAFKFGHLWETIWNDPANAALKEKRGDPNILLPGDSSTIPPVRVREASCVAGATHKFSPQERAEDAEDGCPAVGRADGGISRMC